MRRWLLAAVIFGIVFLPGCGAGGKDVVAEESPLVEVDNAYENSDEIYTREYQDDVYDQLAELRKEPHSLENPLVVANPYGTNTTGLYVWFETEKPARVRYQITTEGFEDFSRTLYNGREDNLATSHEYMLIGCIPGEENLVCITAENARGKKLGSYTFTYQAPEILSTTTSLEAEVTKGESTKPLADGLYTVLGNDTEEEGLEDNVAIYDNDGVLRCEIPIIDFRSHEMIFGGEGMYYSISSSQIACMDRTGYVSRIYDMGDFTLHHDYVFGTRGDLLILAAGKGRETKDDTIISVDLESGEVTEVVDLRKLFPDFLAMMKKPKKADTLDWMHLNSMALVDGDSLIVSARENSTIIRIDDIYGKPRTRYLIGSDHVWAGSGYEDLLLTPVGKFSLQGGQHSVLFQEDDALPEGQYYLLLFNNNNTYSLSRKDYDWSEDENYYNTGTAAESNGFPSYYYKYLVDENAGTFQLVDSLETDYSGFVSSVQPVGENLVIDSGMAMTVYEFDDDGEMIQKLEFTGPKWLYRVKKYDYMNYWFVKD